MYHMFFGERLDGLDTYIRTIVISSSIFRYLSTNIGDLDWRFSQCAKQIFIKK